MTFLDPRTPFRARPDRTLKLRGTPTGDVMAQARLDEDRTRPEATHEVLRRDDGPPGLEEGQYWTTSRVGSEREMRQHHMRLVSKGYTVRLVERKAAY